MATYTKETALYDTGAIAQDIQEAGTKATNYIAADSSGIMVYDGSQGAQTPSAATTKNVFIDADSMDVRNGTDVLATFGANSSRIGAEDSARLLLKPTMMSLVSEENSNFFSVDSDNGQTTGPIKVSDAVSASIISPVTIYINEAPSTAPIKIDCACECHIYFSENKYHSYVTSMASPSDNVHVSFPKISRSGYKDWSAEWKAHLFDIHYGTAISKNASRAYTTLRVDDVNDALTFNVSIEYDGAHQLKVYYSVGRQSPVSAVNNLHIKVGEGRYDGTIHGPAYSIGVRTGISNLYSTIIGRELASGSNDQLCIGRYNDAENIGDCAFVVGNGTSSDAVSNALTVDWNGNVDIASGAKYKVGGTPLSAAYFGLVASYSSSNHVLSFGNLRIYGHYATVPNTGRVSLTFPSGTFSQVLWAIPYCAQGGFGGYDTTSVTELTTSKVTLYQFNSAGANMNVGVVVIGLA